MKKRAVFLDRDGVVIKQCHYLKEPALVELERSVAAGIKKLHDAGFAVIVITNQSGVARGMFTLGEVEAIHDRIQELLKAENTAIDAFYTCPHHPDFDLDCDCRKPKPGMILRAARDFDLDLARSYMCGDKAADVECGNNASCRKSFLVLTGYGQAELSKCPANTPVCRDFAELVEKIMLDAKTSER